MGDEAHPAADVRDVVRVDPRIRGQSVRDDRLRDRRHDLAHRRVVDAQDGDTVERHPLREVDERALQPLEVVPVGLHVIGIDVRDDGEHRRQIQERRVRLVGFGDEEIALAEPRVRVRGKQPPADDERRVEPAFGEHRGDQRSRRRLAVRAGDRDSLLEAHQLGEHQRARHDRYRSFARRCDLRVVGRDGSRHDDDVGIRDVRGRVADLDRDAELRETRGDLARGEIGPRHAIALRREDLGDAAHPRPADADEVHALDLVLHRPRPQRRRRRRRRDPRRPGARACAPQPPSREASRA